MLDSLWFGVPALIALLGLIILYIGWVPKQRQQEMKWEGQDGACSFCGKLVSKHPDWRLPDRVVKYCNGK